MLGITKDFAERIDSCNWLKNCGSYDRIDFEFPVSIAKSRDEAMRSIITIHWDNACIDARGDFDLYLFHNFRELHNNINKAIESIKNNYIRNVMIKIEQITDETDFLGNISYNLTNLFLYNYFSDCAYKSVFFDNLLEVYMRGYLPCGIKNRKRDNIELVIY